MIAAQKLQKMERLNRGRKRFNAFIGFKKLEDPRTRLFAESGPDQGCSYENVCSSTVLPHLGLGSVPNQGYDNYDLGNETTTHSMSLILS